MSDEVFEGGGAEKIEEKERKILDVCFVTSSF